MEESNFLVAINPGDEDNSKFRDFLSSLPKKSRTIFESNVNAVIGEMNGEKSITFGAARKYMIIRTPAQATLATDYFVETPGAALVRMFDVLKVFVEFEKRDQPSSEGHWVNIESGSIDSMIERYGQLTRADPRELIIAGLQSSENLSNYLVEKPAFGIGRCRVAPAYVDIKLETPNERHLLARSGRMGPYSGKIKLYNPLELSLCD